MTTRIGFRKWFKKYWLIIVSATIGLVISVVCFWLNRYMVYSKEMLQSMTEAEATIIGFFGLISTYLLTSYNARLDRLEQQRFESEMANDPKKVTFAKRRMNHIIRIRRNLTVFVALVGLVLIASLLFTIVAQGIQDLNSYDAKGFTLSSLMFLFAGIYEMLLLFFIISKEPEELE